MQTVRIAFIGVSHWHAPLYYRPAVRLPGITVAGVSDGQQDVAARVGAELGVAHFPDHRALVESVKPDFAFVFGRHADLAAIASELIDLGVPMLLEKPGGMNAAEVASVRACAAARGAYVGTGFNFRVSDLAERLRAAIGDDPLTAASFRYIGGGPYRYREAGCAWMLDPALSGGGCLINLAVHFFDLFRWCGGGEATRVSAMTSNASWGLPVEDYACVALRDAAGAVCTVETGYGYPAETGGFDVAFSLRTTRNYVTVDGAGTMAVQRIADGVTTRHAVTPRNAPWYPHFVAQCVDRFVRDRPPVATLDDLVAAMTVVDAAYAADRAGGAAGGPDRTGAAVVPTPAGRRSLRRARSA